MNESKFYYPKLPDNLKQPLQFREPARPFDGRIANPWEILDIFEPVDTLNGAIEVVDANGMSLTFHTKETKMLDENEYGNKDAIYILVKP